MKRILILLLVITGIYIIFTKGISFDWFGTASHNKNAAITNHTEMIKINISSGSTTIIPENRKDLKTVYSGKGKLTIKEKGNKVEVTLKSKWYDWFDWSSPSMLKIYVPEDYNRNMAIELGSGNISFEGSKQVKLEDFTLDIGSGNMNINHLSVKKFYLDGASGSVKMDSLKTTTGTINIASGNINIDHYIGGLKADVASGRLNIQMDKLTDSVDVNLISGLANLDVPKNADFTLNGDILSGKISCDLPLDSKDFSKKRIYGKNGSGKYKINLDVTSGRINIK